MPGKADRKLVEKRCQFCGLLFESKSGGAKYCSVDCRKLAKARDFKKNHSAIKMKVHTPRMADKSIIEVMREVDDYNRTHKKALSYGQYVALSEVSK